MNSSKIIALTIIYGMICISCEDPKEEDVIPPTVTITSPQNNSAVFEIIDITCISTDNDKVSKVELWIDGEFTGVYDESEPYALGWNTTTYANKTYTVTVRSYDSSGNVTDSSPYILTVNNALSNPTASSINSILYGIGGFTINWDKSENGDFQSYSLEKSLLSDMSTRSEVFSSLDINDTVYIDADIDPLVIQYYWTTVTDTFNYSTTGDIDSSSLDPTPNSVEVESISYDTTSMTVTWSESQETDFLKYEVSQSSGDSTNYLVIASILDISITQIELAEFNPLQINYFKVTVFDTLGQYSESNYYTNDVDSPPNSVDVISVTYNLTEMTFNWEEYVPNLSRILLRTSDGMSNDFISYEVLYSVTEDGEKSILTTITDEQVTSHSIAEFNPTHENWFWIRVNDYWEQSSIGAGMTNEIDSPPTPVDVISVGYNFDEMVVTWEQSVSNDFNFYEILRTTDSEGMQSLGVIEDASTTSFVLDEFDPTIENTFNVRVYDYWGLMSLGEGMGNEIDLPPTDVMINPIEYSDGLFIISWNQNQDSDFSEYNLWESIHEDMTNAELIFTSDIRADTALTHQVDEGEVRYYQIIVSDVFGLDAVSFIELGTSYLIFNTIIGGAENDYGQTVRQITDGGFIVMGSTDSYGNGNTDIWLVKTNSLGEEVWRQTFGGVSREVGNHFQMTSDGGFIIVGSIHSEGYYDIWLVKANSSGEEEWNQSFGGELNDFGESVEQTSDGGYIIVGSYQENGGSDIWLLKTNSSGIEEWTQTFGGLFQENGLSVQQTTDGGFIIAGEERSIGDGHGDLWLIKTNSVGEEEWNQTFGGSNDERGISVQQTSDDGYIVTGFTESYGAGSSDIWLIKTNSIGEEEWNQTFGGTMAEWAVSVQETHDGGYILVGSVITEANYDVWVIKTNSGGIEEWNRIFGGLGDDFGEFVKQTLLGGYIVVGSTESFGNGNSDIWLIKTDPFGNTTPY
jgi:hypothetical protein